MSGTLPEAWPYCCVRGQCVVLPGHQRVGARVAEMNGFNVEEDPDTVPRSVRILTERKRRK